MLKVTLQIFWLQALENSQIVVIRTSQSEPDPWYYAAVNIMPHLPQFGITGGMVGDLTCVINQHPYPRGKVNLLNALPFPHLMGWGKGRAIDLVFKTA